MFVYFGYVKEPGDAFHDLGHTAVALPVFGGHQLDALGQRFMALGQLLKAFLNTHRFFSGKRLCPNCHTQAPHLSRRRDVASADTDGVTQTFCRCECRRGGAYLPTMWRKDFSFSLQMSSISSVSSAMRK